MNRRKSFIVFLLFLCFSSEGQDTLKPRNWTLNGYLKEMVTFTYTELDNRFRFENLVHNRLNFRWNISNAVTTGVEARNRFSSGSLAKDFPGYYKAFGDDPGVVDLSWNIASGGSYVLNSSIDRLWVDVVKNNFQFTGGRQRVNWGINYVWNPNDIFNSYSYLDFDYEEKPGSDAVRFQVYPGSTGRVEFTVKAAKDFRWTAAGLYNFNRWNYDFQFLAGWMNSSDLVIGTGWAGQIAGGGFRGELSYFHPTRHFSDTCGIFVGAIGYDYTFRNSMMLQFEALYNGNPNGKMATLLQTDPASAEAMSAKNPFLSAGTVFAGVSYPFHPLVSGSFSGMYNWENRVIIFIPTLTVSLADNLELAFVGQFFQVYDENRFFTGTEFLFLRLKWSF